MATKQQYAAINSRAQELASLRAFIKDRERRGWSSGLANARARLAELERLEEGTKLDRQVRRRSGNNARASQEFLEPVPHFAASGDREAQQERPARRARRTRPRKEGRGVLERVENCNRTGRVRRIRYEPLAEDEKDEGVRNLENALAVQNVERRSSRLYALPSTP